MPLARIWIFADPHVPHFIKLQFKEEDREGVEQWIKLCMDLRMIARADMEDKA